MRLFDPRFNRLMTFLALASVMVLSTCSVNQVGLGAKVDITPPKIKITTVNQIAAKDGQYYKGSLTLNGTASDDIGIGSLTISYLRADNTTVSKALTLTGGTWTVVLNSGTGAADDLKDGAQTLEVVVNDNSSKSSSDRILAYIDNVAPTLMVTYPLSHGTSAALIPQSTDTIDIKGEVSDESPVAQVLVTVLDAGGNPLGTNDPLKNPNPKKADGTNTFATRYYLKGTASIPGLQVTDNGSYYYQVVATDVAGNTSTWYYHSNDLPDLLAAGTPLPNTKELASIDHADAAAVSSPSNIAASALAGVRMGSGIPSAAPERWGNFKYVASSAPSIQFSNLTLTAAQNENLLGPGSVVAGTISPLPNTGAVDSSTVSVKVYQIPVPPYPTTLPAPVAAFDSKSSQLALTSLGDSLGFAVTLKDTAGTALPPNGYFMTVTAKTKNSDLASTQVAFFIDSGAPNLSAATLPAFTKVPFQFTGTAAAALGLESLEVYQSTTADQGSLAATVPLTGTSAGWTTPDLPSPLADGTYNYTLKLLTTSGKTVLLYQSVTYDATPPQAAINPPASLIGTNTVNGDLKFSAAASDINGLTAVKWGFLPTTAAAPAWDDSRWTTFPGTPYEATINTRGNDMNGTVIADNADYKIWVATQDKAGNSAAGSFTVHVDQSSDLPGITFATLDAGATTLTKAAAKAAGNLLESGAKLVPSFADDDGVNLATATIKIDDLLTPAAGATVSMGFAGTTKSKSLEYSLATLSQGLYAATLRVTDINGRTGGVGPVVFAIHTTPPTLTIGTLSGSYFNADFTLAGTALHTLGLDTASAVVIRDEGFAVKKKFAAADLAAGAWSMTVAQGAIGEGSHTWTVTATDYFGKTTTKPFTFSIDRSPPSVPVISEPAPGLTGINALTSRTNLFRGTATDGVGVGNGKIWYRIDKNLAASAGTAGYTAVTALNGPWSFTDSNRAEGSWYVHVKAEDLAGNVTATAATVAFDIDVAAPVLSETVIGNAVKQINTGFSLTGTWTETNGVASFSVVQVKDGDTANGKTLPVDANFTTVSAWELKQLPRNPATPANLHLADGLYDYTFTITDLAGKTTTLLRSFRLDTTGPELNILNPSDDASWSSTSSYTISGAATDLTAVRAIYHRPGVIVAASALAANTVYQIVFPGTSNFTTVGAATSSAGATFTASGPTTGTGVALLVPSVPTPAATTTDAGWTTAGWTKITGTNSWSLPLSGLTQSRFHAQWVSAVDSAGNASVPQSRVFGVDTAKPTLSASTPAANINTGFSLTGTSFDSVGVASVTVTQTKNGGSVVVIDTNPPTTSDGWATWSLANLPRNPASIGAQATLDTTSDGVYDYQITVTDLAGKTETLTRTVRFDKTNPIGSIDDPSNAQIINSASYSFTGSATDGGASGIALVEYSLDSGTTWPDAVGTSSWSFNIANMAASFGSEGPKAVQVRASDNAGNVSSPITRNFVFDTAVPVLSVTGPATLDTKTSVNLAGTASDNYGVASITVRQNSTVISTNPVSGTTAWSITGLPREGAGLGTPQASLIDGTYIYDITATDLAGKTSLVSTVTIRIDQTAPDVLTITEPGASQTGDNSLTGKTNVFRGTASDAAGGLGMAKVWYAIDGSASAPAVVTTPAAAGYTGVASGANWSFTDSNRNEGSYYLHVLAEDLAGNLMATAVTRAFDIDVAAPVLAGTTFDAPTPAAMTSTVVNTKVGYAISGTWTESQGVASFTVTQSKDGASAVALTTGVTSITGASATPAAWSLTGLPRDPGTPADTLLADGLYEYVFTIADLAGKSTTITRTVRFDQTAPELTVTSPSDNSWAGTASLTITGVATDSSGSGITAVQYSTDGTNYSPVSGSFSSWNIPLTGLTQGSKIYYLRATDATANVSAPLALHFGVDLSAPAVPTETSSPGLSLTKVGFDLGGALADTNALENVTVTQKKDLGGAVELLNLAKTGTASTWSLTGLPRDPGTPANTLVADGSYEYVITVRDVAGKTTVLNRTIRVDATGPSATIDDPGLYLSGNSGSLFGSADDASGSGIDKVQYSLTSAAGPWIDATGKNNWLVSLNLDTDGAGADTGLAEGAYTLYVQALDKAGNPTASAASQPFTVDQAAPGLTLYKVDGADFTADTIFGNATLNLSGTAVDTYGVAAVSVTQFKAGGNTDTLTVSLNAGTTSRTWTAAADMGQGEGTYTLTITITDAVGRQTNIQKTVVKDTQAPGLALVTTPAAAGQWLSGATFNFAGTAADVGTAGIGTVYYGYGARGLTPATDLNDPFWSQATGTTTWTASVSLTGEGERRLYLKAVDKAGNISALQTFDYGIDQSNPSLGFGGPTGTFFNGNFTLSGTASDTNSLTSVTVAEKRPGDVFYQTAENATLGSGTWTLLKVMNAMDGLPSGVYEYRITATDAAGKSVSYDKSLTRDMTNPAVTLNAPLPTIGGPVTYDGNGTLTLSGTVSDLNGLDALEIQVGAGGWTALGSAPFTSFSTTLDTTALTDLTTVPVTIRATDKAGNPGTSAYSISINQASDKPVVTITGPTAAENIQSANISMTGTITDDDGINTAGLEYRLSYNGGTTYSAWTAIPAGNLSGGAVSKSFTYSLNDPSNGPKVLQIRATDTGATVGNAASVSFTQDTGAPILTALSPTEGWVTAAPSFIVSGTATDSAAVTSVTYRVLRDGTEIVATAASTLGSDTGSGNVVKTFTTPAISTAPGSGNYQIQLISSDGTNTRQETINVVVDTTAPAVAFSTPAAASLQNNVITLTGTSSDNRLVSSVAVEIWKGGSKVADAPGTVSGTSNWSLSFNTADFDDVTNAVFVSGSAYDITLKAVAVDTVGNVGTSSSLTFRIDQATDSPVIGVSTAQSPTYLSSFTVNGTADDDDGISLIEVSANGSSWTTLTPPGGGWTKNSSWNTALAAGDGAKALYVRVTDSSTPGIVTTSSVFNFRIDQEAPDGSFSTPAVNSKLKTGEFAFTGSFADESTVTNVQLKVDSGDFGSGDVKTAVFTPGLSGAWSYTFASGDLPDGVRTIYLQVTDAAGKTSSVTRAVTVDKTAPAVTLTEPANASSAFGLVRLRGSALDATSGVKSVKIGLGKTINTADWDNVGNTWYSATGTVSWEYVITNINNYANTTFATDLGDTDADGVVDGGETWQGIWRIYLYVRSEDTAGLGATGNMAVTDTYYLEVDPLRDRPEITVLQPVDATSTVGGFLRIVGSAYDTNFIAKNQIAFDVNNNGVFNDGGDIWPSAAGFTPPASDQSDANTTAWYAMTGTTSWSTIINNGGEFNPTGVDTTKTVKFKVRSVDSKVAHGGTPSLAGLESVYTVTFSNQVPQYSAVSLATGDTIGGIKVLTAYVKVPSLVGMASIRFNHDGPRLSSTELIGGSAGMQAVKLNSGDAGYEADFDKYAITATINTGDADLFPGNAGSMTVSLRAYDNSAFQSFQTISLSVDNKAPTSPSFNSLVEIAGTAALVQGSVSDTGVISGIKKVVFYLQKGTSVYRLKGGSGSLTNGAGEVLDLTNAAYNDYRIVVDKTTEGGNDAGAGGDLDGFHESLTSSFSVYTWNAAFDSTLVTDGRYDAKFTAYDVGGNSTTHTQSTFLANQKPSIASILLATDLNGNGSIDAGEYSSAISANYATTGYTGRGGKLGFTINTSGGNGTKRYSVVYNSVERNATLTANALVVDTTGISDSSAANDRVFTVLVYDSTTSDDADFTDELSSTITVGVTIDNVDDVPPTAAIAEFGKKYSVSDDDGAKTLGAVTAYSDNIKLSGATLLGHLEYATDSLHNGTDADVSGEVIFKGKVADNQRVNRITATISTFDPDGAGAAAAGSEFDVYTFAGGALTGTGWAFAADGSNYLTEAKGNVFNWNFTWNSALVANVAENNVTVTIKVYDAAGNTNAAPQILTVDVVPYITGITTLLNNLSITNPSVYNRTALGKYPVNATETIKLSGFNLTTSGGTPAVAITGISSGITATGGVVSVPMTSATTGNLALTVNSVPLLNNGNANTSPQNKLPNNVNNALLTDDVALDVWQFNSQAAVPISGQVADPVMKINPVSGKVGFAFSNGPLYFSMGGNVGGTEYSYYYWQASYDFLTSIAFAYDSAGRSYGSAAGGDINSNSADKFTFMTDRWGISGLTNNGSYGGTNALRMESIGLNISAVNEFDKYRIKSPNYATSRLATGAISTNVYLAYFDNMRSEIVFRYGNLADTQTTKANFSNFRDTDTAGAPPAYSNTYKSIVAGSTTGRNAGEYVSIAVIPGATVSADVVVMVWYDATSQCLWYSYNTTPTTDRGGTATAAGWSTPLQIFTNAGEHCQIAVDAGGGVHIAAYDITNASLLYANLATYNAASASTSVVDSYGIVGTNITLDVASNGTNYIPYIGYYAPSSIRPKYAYLVDTSTPAPNGAVNDSFTGAWEVTLLPTTSSIPQDRINVGVWKTAAGVLKNSVTGTSSTTKTGSGYTATNNGQNYGNGTSNGILAYQIKVSTNGYIETAQKK